VFSGDISRTFPFFLCCNHRGVGYLPEQWILCGLAARAQASEWNFLSRNVTSDMLAWNGDLGLSGIVLYSVEAAYHYSTNSPGSFYVDDLTISTG